ncbi:hypothetical protein [Streptosporangium sp. NPDC023615]|uniref:hypothetical protein n=1 Tax=Streptosporangium sp. NPDC023615 TaxID=3154794 RepID=UPI00342B32D0
MRCTQCDNTDLESGFIDDAGEYSPGYGRWIAGPLDRGMFGNAKRFGKPRWEIEAFRCTRCFHLELFARNEA